MAEVDERIERYERAKREGGLFVMGYGFVTNEEWGRIPVPRTLAPETPDATQEPQR